MHKILIVASKGFEFNEKVELLQQFLQIVSQDFGVRYWIEFEGIVFQKSDMF